MGDHYKLYVVNYDTHLRKAKYHQALFVEMNICHGDKRGAILQVHGPFPLDKSQSFAEFVFKLSTNAAPKHSAHFVSWKEIGCLNNNDIVGICEVCDEVKPPIVPVGHQGESPNGCDWVKNVIYKLSKTDLVTFSKDYVLPSRQVNLVSKYVSTEQGSSSRATEGGSSSRATEGGSSSRATEGGSSSRAAEKGSSSKSTDKGSSSKSADKKASKRGSRH